MLDPRIVTEIRTIQQRLTSSGALPSSETLNRYYAAFRERFGPERLSSMDGENLLVTMHGLFSANRDTMAYWLEFKNDEEFPTTTFGGIAGGSALKWGVYPDAKTGQWMTRGQRSAPMPIPLDEAISIARKHREQLLRGVDLLRQLPENADDAAYAGLQKGMDSLAPDVSSVAWGHKYFAVTFPDKLDDYHLATYQRFHLVRLLQPDIPSADAGRYITAGRFLAVARELEMPVNHLTTILNERSNRPYKYWRVTANYHIKEAQDWMLWPAFLEEGIYAVHWSKVGDLSEMEHNQASKDALRTRMMEAYDAGPNGRWVNELLNAVAGSSAGDIVLAMDGDAVAGVGRIVGEYQYVPGSRIPHQKKVEWLSDERWVLPRPEGKGSVFRELKDFANLVEAERRILGEKEVVPPPQPTPSPRLSPLSGQLAKIEAILNRKGQVILYGPPGTGKTYAARNAAQELAARSALQHTFADLDEAEKHDLLDPDSGLVRMVTFHPGYGYEEFIEGYRPTSLNGQMQFEVCPGIFKKLCRDAAADAGRRYYLLIDEINRGDIPRIFGELLTLLEKDKRGASVLLPISGESFSVPPNVFVIATMNTADRSIALLDTALRRRFGFLELLPDAGLLSGAVVEGVPLGPWLEALNQQIIKSIGRDARNLQVGHAYLMDRGKPVADFQHMVRVLQEDIIPLLEEYCYDDYAALEKILGNGLIDASTQRIRHELFAPGRKDDLLSALLQTMPELTATYEATNAPESQADEDDESDDSEDESGQP